MRIRTALVLCAFLPFAAQAADTYKLDPAHTSVVWEISHFGFSHPAGKFAMIDGTLTLDEAKPENSKVTASIPIASLATAIPKLDEHLKSKDFFDAAQFPTASFESTKVDFAGKDSAIVHGNLTLHGVTKPVALAVKLNKIGDNMMKKHTAGFSATTVIKRSDFGMVAYLPGLGDDVNLTIETEANQ